MNPCAEPALQTYWGHLIQALHLDETVAAETWAALVRAYSEPGRYYHTLDHVRQVLATLDTFGGQAADPAALQLAAWFHDVVYDSRAGDNEERSAQFAAETLRRMNFPAARTARVTCLILETKTHEPEGNEPDSQLFLDADLAILGAPEGEYQAYARAIRREFGWVAEEAYWAGRQEVLRKFLRRPRIYFTDALYAAQEVRARANLEGEVRALAGG
jgi:predicted metal-dependent HD superfamily phosphohydrolase